MAITTKVPEQVKVYKVKSDTKKGEFYLVRFFPLNNKFVCECPSYVFNAEGFECKHIKKAQKYLAMKAKKKI